MPSYIARRALRIPVVHETLRAHRLARLRRQKKREMKKDIFTMDLFGKIPDRVYNEKEFGGVFNEGEKVLELHLFAVTPRQMVRTLKTVFERMDEWKKQGYVGIYGDTPTPSLFAAFEKQGARIVESPRLAAWFARRHYKRCVREFNFPKEFLNMPVRRIALRFK